MLSHQHKCVFVHIPKAAGQSIARAFLQDLGLGWEDRGEFLMKPNRDPKAGPPRLAHLKASQYVSCGHMSESEFRSYYKFAFVRDPWARVVSFYRYLAYDLVLEFREFLFGPFLKGHWEAMHWFVCPQYDYLHDENGRLLVDFVGRVENMDEDFTEVCSRLGTTSMSLEATNQSGVFANKTLVYVEKIYGNLEKVLGGGTKLPPQHEDYRDYYDPECNGLVRELYSKDIEEFGYESAN